MSNIIVNVPARKVRYDITFDGMTVTRGVLADFLTTLLECGISDFELLDMRTKKLVPVAEREEHVAPGAEFMLVGPDIPVKWASGPRSQSWSHSDMTLRALFRGKFPNMVPVITHPASVDAEWRDVTDARIVCCDPRQWTATEIDDRYTALTAMTAAPDDNFVRVLVVDATTWTARWIRAAVGSLYATVKSRFTALELYRWDGTRVSSDECVIPDANGQLGVLFAHGFLDQVLCALAKDQTTMRARVDGVLQPPVRRVATVCLPYVAIQLYSRDGAKLAPCTVTHACQRARARFDDGCSEVGVADHALKQAFAPDSGALIAPDTTLHALDMTLVRADACWRVSENIAAGAPVSVQLLRALRFGSTSPQVPVWFNGALRWVNFALTPQQAVDSSAPRLWANGALLLDQPIGPQLPPGRVGDLNPVVYLLDNAEDRMITIVTNCVTFAAEHVKLVPGETYGGLVARIHHSGTGLAFDWVGTNMARPDDVVDASRSPVFVVSPARVNVTLLPPFVPDTRLQQLQQAVSQPSVAVQAAATPHQRTAAHPFPIRPIGLSPTPETTTSREPTRWTPLVNRPVTGAPMHDWRSYSRSELRAAVAGPVNVRGLKRSTGATVYVSSRDDEAMSEHETASSEEESTSEEEEAPEGAAARRPARRAAREAVVRIASIARFEASTDRVPRPSIVDSFVTRKMKSGFNYKGDGAQDMSRKRRFGREVVSDEDELSETEMEQQPKASRPESPEGGPPASDETSEDETEQKSNAMGRMVPFSEDET